MNRQIMEQEMQISQKHTEKFSTAPVVRKHANQNKVALFLLTKVPKKTPKPKNISIRTNEGIGKQILSHDSWGYENATQSLEHYLVTY